MTKEEFAAAIGAVAAYMKSQQTEQEYAVTKEPDILKSKINEWKQVYHPAFRSFYVNEFNRLKR